MQECKNKNARKHIKYRLHVDKLAIYKEGSPETTLNFKSEKTANMKQSYDYLLVISSGQAILIRSAVAGESRRKGAAKPASTRALRTASLIARYTERSQISVGLHDLRQTTN
jgi:hypothetical protein